MSNIRLHIVKFSSFHDRLFRKFLICLLCVLSCVGEAQSQGSVQDVIESVNRSVNDFILGKISIDAAIDSLDSQASLIEDNFSKSSYRTDKWYIHFTQAQLYMLIENYVVVDSLIHVCLSLSDDSLKQATLEILNEKSIKNADRFFDIKEFAKGRRILEFINPYLTSSYLKKWQEVYAGSYRKESRTVPYGDRHSFDLLRKSLSLCQEWNLTEGETYSMGAIGNLFDYYGEVDSVLYYYEESSRLAQLYNLPGYRIQMLIALADIYWERGDLSRYEYSNTCADSLADYIKDGQLLYSYYDHQYRRYYYQLKSWKQAKIWLNKAEQWCEALDHPFKNLFLVEIYSQKTNLLLELGEYDEALSYGLKALQYWQMDTRYSQIWSGSFVKNPFAVLSQVYQVRRDSVNQFACLDSLVEFANRSGNSIFTKERAYRFRGECFEKYNDYKRALQDYETGLGILELDTTKDFHLRISLLYKIGMAQLQIGEKRRGLETLLDVYELLKSLDNSVPHDYLSLLTDLAFAYRLNGDPATGCGYWDLYVQEIRKYIRTEFSNISLSVALGKSSEFSDKLLSYIAYLVQSDLIDSHYLLNAYDAYLLSKLWIVDKHRSILHRIQQEGDQQLVRDYLKLIRLNAQMQSELQNQNGSFTKYELIKLQIDSLHEELKSNSKEYGDLTGGIEFDYNSIQAQLQPNEYLINFILTYDYDLKDYSYTVVLVHKDLSYPLGLNLPIPGRLLHGNTEFNIYSDTDLSKEFLEYVWQPIAKHIPPGSTVYYCSNESLSDYAIENIPFAKDSVLGDRYNIRRISSVLSLFETNRHDMSMRNSPLQAILYGGLRYDLTSEEKAAAETAVPMEPWVEVPLTASRKNISYQYLPGTDKEVIGISSLLSQANVSTIVRKGTQGTKQSFLSMSSNAPNILHLSTHGFHDVEAFVGSLFSTWDEPNQFTGLVLSGGNDSWHDINDYWGTSDGLITAYEIALMDLSDIDLLVLSACDTGKHSFIDKDENSLVSAFKRAGVKSIIMTLWEVSDKATQQFMVRFYEELIAQKWNKRGAFEAAKAYIRQLYKDDPFYWAGFVLVDD